MTREEFLQVASRLVNDFIFEVTVLDGNPQLRVNPLDKSLAIISGDEYLNEIANSDEAIENAAHAEDAMDEEASDYQAAQNPDFYPIRTLVKVHPGARLTLDEKALERVADSYAFER